AGNVLRGRRGAASLGETGAFVRLAALAGLGPQPWRSRAAPGRDLGLRLRRLGVLVRHDPRLRVVVGATRPRHLLRSCARVLHGQLAGPGSWRDRVARAGRLAWWPVPGVVTAWAVAAF